MNNPSTIKEENLLSADNPVIETIDNPNQKNLIMYFVIGFFVVLILGVGLVFTLFSNNSPSPRDNVVIPPTQVPSPVSTNSTNELGWQTYTDSKLGFSFQYPSNWAISTPTDLSGQWLSATAMSVYSPENTYREGEPIIIGEFSVSLLKTPQYSVAGVVDSYDFGSPNQTSGPKTVNGLTGTEVISPNGFGNADRQAFFIEHDGLIYHLQSTWQSGRNDNAQILQQVMSSFSFGKQANTETQGSTSPMRLTNGADLKSIKYTLPSGWKAELRDQSLFLSVDGGGYLSLAVHDYPVDTGRREKFCQIQGNCTGSSTFTEVKLGNISGYRAQGLDNSGGGTEYFGAKGDKFYIITSYGPPAPNQYDQTYQQVLDSLMF